MTIREQVREMDGDQLLEKARQIVGMQGELLDDVPLFGFESEKAEWLHEIAARVDIGLNYLGDRFDHVDPNAADAETLAYVEELDADWDRLKEIERILVNG